MSDIQSTLKDLSSAMNNLPDDKKKVAMEAMTKEVSSDKVKTDLKTQISALTGSATSIDSAFERITLQLLIADRKNYKRKNGSPVRKLAGEWGEHQKTFDKLLRTSLEAATDTVAYIDQYINFLVPMISKPVSEVPLDDKKGMVNEFAAKGEPGQMNTNKTHEESVKLSANFKNLGRDISAFALEFNDYGKEVETEWKDDARNLGKEINDLKIQLEEYGFEIVKLSIALGLTVVLGAGAAVGALIAFGPAGPFVAAGIIIVGLIAAGVESVLLAKAVGNRDETQGKIDKKSAELVDLKAALKGLGEVQAELEKAHVDIQEICRRLSGFSSVWTAVAYDARLLVKGVEFMTDTQYNYAMTSRIPLTVASYNTLKEALEQYAKLIEAELPPSKA